MVRKMLIPLLALAGAACSEDYGGGNLVHGMLPGPSDPAATIRVTAGEGGEPCRYHWNSDVVTRDEIARRSRENMDAAVAAAGGVDSMTSSQIPYLKLEVAPDLAFSCVEPVIAIVRDLGHFRIGLKPNMTAPSAHFVQFPMTQVGAAPPVVTVTVAARGNLSWNGEPIDLFSLGARARPMADAASEAGAPGQIVLVPAPEASFVSVYEAVRVIRDNYVEPDIAPPPAVEATAPAA